MSVRRKQFIHDVRAATTQALDAFGLLNRLGEEFNRAGMAARLQDGDFAEHDMTKQEFLDAVNTWSTLLPGITNADKAKLNRIRN